VFSLLAKKNSKIKIQNPWKKQPLDWSSISSEGVRELWNAFTNENFIVNGKVTQSIPLSSRNREIIEKVIELKTNKVVPITDENSTKPFFSKKKIDTFFGSGKSEDGWDWEKFKTTEGFPVSPDLMDWIIGQDKSIEECKLCLDEWIHKLKGLKERKWWKFWEKPETKKPQAKEWLPAGPFLLLLGTQGTGKSLLGRALTTHLTKLYKEHNIQLYDVVSWKNKVIPSNPRISIHPSPKGQELVIKEKKKISRKGLLKKWGMRILQWTLGITGTVLLGITFYLIFKPWIFNDMIQVGYVFLPAQVAYSNFFEYFMARIIGLFPLLIGGGSLLFYGIFIGFFGRFFGRGGGKGIGGAEATDAPKLLIDNSDKDAKFIDATGHGSAQLFGSIAWDPYQTGGLGTPEHQRVGAGDVHRAFMGILYIDEIKNLHKEEATTLLTVLEDGQLSIALRSQWHGGDTAAMAVSTEPVPCMTFFVCAGNLDSVLQIHPALMDRIRGYGKVVYMNDDMPNSVKNRRKYVQFITQEASRFKLLPFTRQACIEILEEARRKSGRKDRLTCIFRPMISVIKTASVLAMNEGLKSVEVKHVREAIEEHCKSINLQVIERMVENREVYRVIDVSSKPKVGSIHGLGVAHDKSDGSTVGSIIPIRASMIKVKKNKSGYFHVTGVSTSAESFIQHSIAKIRHVISENYDLDPKDDYKTHIDFSQFHGVDGPSAGIAMTLALASIIEWKRIRQDVAVTGEINIKGDGEVIVTPVGRVHEKILAAQRWGFKKVLIPTKNFINDIKVKDYKIEIVGCETLEDYKREIFCKRKF